MNYYKLNTNTIEKLKKLKGPIMIFGAGGFIGVNLLKTILNYRDDVFGVSQEHNNNWRFVATSCPKSNLRTCDISHKKNLKELIKEIKPKTVFNLAAYGAYSKQKEYDKIYRTNFIASVDIVEALKETGFEVFIQAGSSSEYGLNSIAPSEDTNLIPNSHYAVSKTAIYHAIKYFGEIEKLPVAHLRLYSGYGPWEEPDRLIPVLLSNARKGKFPALVQPEISRDFIHVKDIVSAFVSVASEMKEKHYGQAFNVGTGIKTTIKELALLVKEILQIENNPKFGNMENRNWDLPDWFANPQKIINEIGWKPEISLKDGIIDTITWQKEVNFDDAFWNRQK
ncbi:MAG: NAD-dependent epimerase/dehydratase family protein [Saprospiraceae bacterium]|nr:NAD-dependent epimerase/dehydratase family protein [Saprospiraceae bacterium]